jgi:hypothetical protein
MLTIYETPTFVAEAAKDNIPGYILKEVRKEIEDDRS